jgi:hypothetical protein
MKDGNNISEMLNEIELSISALDELIRSKVYCVMLSSDNEFSSLKEKDIDNKIKSAKEKILNYSIEIARKYLEIEKFISWSILDENFSYPEEGEIVIFKSTKYKEEFMYCAFWVYNFVENKPDKKWYILDDESFKFEEMDSSEISFEKNPMWRKIPNNEVIKNEENFRNR